MNNSDTLLVSTADWDNPYWTNKQHVAVQLAGLGHRVLYVESQGLRRPTVSGRDFRRILNRLKKGLRKPREVMPNLWVWSPIVIPFQGSTWVRALNRVLLQCGYRLWAKFLGLDLKLMWTYSPLTLEFYNVDCFETLVYHAVDDIKAQPGMPREAIEVAENSLSKRADIIFTTAPNLQAIHQNINSNTYYFPNVADYEHFNRALDPNTPIPPDMGNFLGPVIGFVGAVSSYKLDFRLILVLAKARPDYNFVFVGEIGEGDPWTRVNIFDAVSNVHFLGGREYGELPSYLKAMDVAILPNLLNEYTKSMFPMKFFEYLAAGRPVVSVNLPALADYQCIASLCSSDEEFLVGLDNALTGQCAALDARLAVAKQQTYQIRTKKMIELICDGSKR